MPAKKKTATTNKAVAKKEAAGAVASTGIDFDDDAGKGLEGADKDSYAIPFLRVVQGTSPQVKESEPEYNPKAKPGMLVNTVTGELIDGKQGAILLPVAFERRFIRWQARSQGGGFVGQFTKDEVDMLREAGEITELDGVLYYDTSPKPKTSDTVVDTRSHFCLLVRENGIAERVLLALSSTQVKKSRQLMTILSQTLTQNKAGKLVNPPSWMIKIRITTGEESNEQGSWYGVNFKPEGLLDNSEADLYQMGQAFYKSVQEGRVEVNFKSNEEESSSGSGKF